ncbi:MAG TPA: hypothetical protein VFK94_06380 [Patescibacteria group bacterium]|nr:hypothetical protein [Patescibacteria group bacterium]
MTYPRTIPFGREGFANPTIAKPPTPKERGIKFEPKEASAETTMDNPPGAGPASIFAPIQTPSDQADRTTTLADLYSMYNQYLGRNPIFGEEAGGAAEGWVNPETGERQGRMGLNFTTSLNQIRGSQEFKNRVAAGFRPKNMDPFTGKVNPNPTTSGTLFYAKGGTIKEPVFGTGLMSGKHYMIGEEGPEKVTPISRPPKRR